MGCTYINHTTYTYTHIYTQVFVPYKPYRKCFSSRRTNQRRSTEMKFIHFFLHRLDIIIYSLSFDCLHSNHHHALFPKSITYLNFHIECPGVCSTCKNVSHFIKYQDKTNNIKLLFHLEENTSVFRNGSGRKYNRFAI